MKSIFCLTIFAATLFSYQVAVAQGDLQNTGIMFVTGSTDTVCITGSMTNASTAALTNNGNLYIKQNLVNAQASMAVGTGSLYLKGSAAQTLSGAQAFKTFNLITDNTAGIVLSNDLSVNGVHTFIAGIITTSATPNYISYESGASYTGDGDSRHVNGWIKKTGSTNFIFPTGNGVAERTIGISNIAAPAVFNARYAGPTTNTGNVAAPLVVVDPNEYWLVNQVSGGTANIDMNWNNAKIAMPQYALPDIRVAKYTTGNWTQAGGSATGNTATTGNISSGTLSSFGPFTFGSITLALPLTLVQFSATAVNGLGFISWSTTDEINVHHFNVQRSDDGLRFYTIGDKPAANLAGLHNYTLTDKNALNEITYYRLLSVDIDGKTKLSKIVTVKNTAADSYMSVVNPARNSILITSKNISGSFTYRLNTLAGQTIQQGPLTFITSSASIVLPGAFKPGVYILQIQKQGFNFTRKVVVE